MQDWLDYRRASPPQALLSRAPLTPIVHRRVHALQVAPPQRPRAPLALPRHRPRRRRRGRGGRLAGAPRGRGRPQALSRRRPQCVVSSSSARSMTRSSRTATVAFVHGPQGSGKSRMLSRILKDIDRCVSPPPAYPLTDRPPSQLRPRDRLRAASPRRHRRPPPRRPRCPDGLLARLHLPQLRQPPRRPRQRRAHRPKGCVRDALSLSLTLLFLSRASNAVLICVSLACDAAPRSRPERLAPRTNNPAPRSRRHRPPRVRRDAPHGRAARTHAHGTGRAGGEGGRCCCC